MPRQMFNYRLYPSKTQTKVLDEQLELCRQTYNWLLQDCRSTYKETGKLLTQFDLNQALTALKRQRSETKKVHSQVLQNISKRIKDGYTSFFARREAGLKAGLPRFKKYGRYRSITYPQSGFKIEDDRLSLSKVGEIKIQLHREIQGRIKTLTVKRLPSGKWYACFSCIVEAQLCEKPFEDVGIDVGLNSYAILSDGTRIGNPRHLRKSEKRLASLQRCMSRKRRGSRNWVKARTRVARLHEMIGNCRTDFLHKASRKIADTYETVYVEDLKIMNMVRNHCLAKSISDAGWGRFMGMIAYKAESAGGRLIQVDPRGTTQVCCHCGETVLKTLSDRIHACPCCGLVMSRDLNAALNILVRGREIGKELAEFRPVEEKATVPSYEMVHVYPMKQEASLLVGR
ncbi:MAG TPA: transposase [Candidatus Desulfaltia sp.]|nr:transposase [Candidatus Desulfaltia sp.]